MVTTGALADWSECATRDGIAGDFSAVQIVHARRKGERQATVGRSGGIAAVEATTCHYTGRRQVSPGVERVAAGATETACLLQRQSTVEEGTTEWNVSSHVGSTDFLLHSLAHHCISKRARAACAVN